MKKLLSAIAVAATFLIGSMSGAMAACSGPAIMHDFANTAFNMSLITAQDGNCASNVGLNTSTAGAMVAGVAVDGWDLTQGAKADAAYAGSGSASVVAALKGIYAITNTLNGTAGNPLATQAISNIIGGVGLNATPTLANGNGVVPTQGGTALSATNGGFQNLLQGNAVISATNGIYANVLQGNAALSATNGTFANILQGNAVLSNTNPLPGTITDGTNGPAAVKAASTAPAAADKALVTDGRPATATTPIAVAASDNHFVLKNGAGVAMSVHTSNNSATKNYLRLYDAGTGFNGCNSATGVIFAMEIPPTDGGFSVSLGGGSGIAFTNGLSWCITSGFGLTDTTNATASAIYANASYK